MNVNDVPLACSSPANSKTGKSGRPTSSPPTIVAMLAVVCTETGVVGEAIIKTV